ncbi:uncharacterized protein LOC135149875 isoform X2 [Daucus carota subsp. sativus]
MKVTEFIQQPGMWNSELIQQLFLTPDSELILSIPLSPFDHPDSWFWHYSRNGNYSVKSGYMMAISNSKSGDSSSSDVVSKWWKAFWAVKIPRKILLFAWRGYHEILPTWKGIYRRNVSSHSSCPICGFGEDSNAHAVFWCLFSQSLWETMDYPFLVGHKEEISFRGVLLYASELLEKEEFARMLITAWGLWIERNKRTHGQQQRNPQQLKNWLTLYYDEIKMAHEQESGAQKSRENSIAGQIGRDNSHANQVGIETQDLDLFVDAAISTFSQKVGLGAVIVTQNKRSLAALSKPLEGALSVLHAEALSLLVGLQWTQFSGLTPKRILSDSLSVVQAVNNEEVVYHNEMGILIADIRRLFSNFPDTRVSHTSRKHNYPAHNMARQALQLNEEVSWMEDVPHHAENHM